MIGDQPASARTEHVPWDVIVVGAGPAGSASAGLLARAGQRVLVLEREHFPRFRIGESLLPACLPVLEELQIPPVEDTFVFKRGARFLCEATGRERCFAFGESSAGPPRHAWHVDRARFDALLSRRAAELGATVRHGETVLRIAVEGRRVCVETEAGRHAARFLVDATGQGRLGARTLGKAVPYRRFGSSAVYTHFEGLGDGALAELGPDFDIRILVRSDGWGWIIPLPERRLSVGVVTKGRATERMLDEGLLAGPLATRLLAGARRLSTRVVAGFSYRNTCPSGPRFVSIGDAACFLDPVFSSGVTLGLRGAQSMVAALLPALREGREDVPELFAAHEAEMDRAHRTFAGLIDRFYNTNIAQALFLSDSDHMPNRAGVMSVLAGDVWRRDNPFQEMLLNAKRLPADLGEPLP